MISKWVAARYKKRSKIKVRTFLLLLYLLLHCPNALAHGGVFLEDDLCVIQIGFYKAHFTIYQPQKSQHKEFCEDIPYASESVFVMEYMHDGLNNASIDFRIIKDVLGRGRFFQQGNLKQISDLDLISVFYQTPSVHNNGVLLALYPFKEEGNYVGIVTADIPGSTEKYIAVFPFRVGDRKWGYIPLLIALALFLQLNYWLLNGGYNRIRYYLKK